jgi:hypothetical protein
MKGKVMNPIRWSKGYKAALILALAIGISGGIILGYLVYATGSGADGAISFKYWINRSGVYLWGIWGAAISVALIFIKHLTREPAKTL